MNIPTVIVDPIRLDGTFWMALFGFLTSGTSALLAYLANKNAGAAHTQGVINAAKTDAVSVKADTAIVQSTKAAEQSASASATSAEVNKNFTNHSSDLKKMMEDLRVSIDTKQDKQ